MIEITHTDVAEDGEALVAARMQALAHPARLRILRHLACRDACCCKDVVGEIGLAQSTVSQHLKVLVDAGLVLYRPERQASRYSLDRAAIDELSETVRSVLAACSAVPNGSGRGPC